MLEEVLQDGLPAEINHNICILPQTCASMHNRETPTAYQHHRSCSPAFLDAPKRTVYICFDLLVFAEVRQTIHNQHDRIQNSWNLQIQTSIAQLHSWEALQQNHNHDV